MIFSEPSQRHLSRAVPSVAVTKIANVRQLSTMKPLEAIRCTVPTCRCECFAPGKRSLRYCDTCNHGWVAHALDKLGTNPVMNLGLQVEIVQPNIVFDIASLMLYGAHATPVRLKILLDRLFSVLQHDEVLQILHGFGWTYEDYARGYILQDNTGRVLDKWCVASLDEELVVLQQFLRFGETKAIAQEIILQDTKNRHEVLVKHTPTTAESDIKKFIERSNLTVQNYIKSYENTRQLFDPSPVQFISPGSRIVPSHISPNFSSSREPRVTMPHTPPTSSTPMNTPPLNCLQVVRHFDIHKEQPSPVINLSLGGPDIRRSPKCDSPQNLSTASTLVSVASPSHQVLQSQVQQQHQGLDEIDGSELYLSESDDDGEALDYSNKDNPDSPVDEDKKGKQHVRKSTNPMKRQWTPSASFGSTYVGANGKKRVLCAACNKTFCDKGALKIHYSAVHLKEMHKCTVEGCHMMFSSRRSRNRHSANPNPKLHMIQKRKDDLDQTDDMDQSKINDSITSAASTTPAKSSPTSSPVPSNHSQIPSVIDSLPIIRTGSNFYIDMSTKFPFMAPPEKRIKLEDEKPTDLSKFPLTISPDDEPCDLSKKLDDDVKLEIDLDKCIDENEDVMHGDGEYDDIRVKINNEWLMKGGKRRKNTAPTKCAQIGPCFETNYDENASKASNEKSSFNIRHSEILDFSGGTSLNARSNKLIYLQESADTIKKNNEYQYRDQEKQIGEFHLTESLCSQDSQEKKNERYEARNFPKIASLLWAGNVNTNTTDVSDDMLDKALHKTDDNFTKSDESTKWEVSEDTSESDDSSEEEETLSPNPNMQDYPPDVYIDKDHPLKCKICNKIFHNSFTVKIHFQNVHLKVMHPCTVDGCSATFSSKRSRNRHSANLNLHRRVHIEDVDTEKEMDETMRGNILARLYGHDLISSNLFSNSTENLRNNEIKLVRNNNDDLKQGQNEGQFYNINNNITSIVSASASQEVAQHCNNVHNSKPHSTGSETTFEESERESENIDKDERANENRIQDETYGTQFSSSAVTQDQINISHHENSHSSPGSIIRKTVSPRRPCNKQKTLNGMTTRKVTSL